MITYKYLFELLIFNWRIVSDQFRGLDFIPIVLPEDLGLDGNVVNKASPSSSFHLVRILRELSITPEDAILDIGCAKGHAMRCMADFPFRRIGGLELSAELVAIAKNNFIILGKRQATEIHIICDDARNYAGYGKYNIFYLYNPFPDCIGKDVFPLLQKQHSRNREKIIIYNTPNCHQTVLSCGFSHLRTYPGAFGNVIHVYSDKPHSSRLRASAVT